MIARYQKLINLDPEEKDGLEKIMKEVKTKGCNVSMMRLISDSIRIFIDQYGNDAVEKYTIKYKRKR